MIPLHDYFNTASWEAVLVPASVSLPNVLRNLDIMQFWYFDGFKLMPKVQTPCRPTLEKPLKYKDF